MKKLLPILTLMATTATVHAQRFLTEVFPSFTKTANVQYGSNITVQTTPPASQPLLLDVYEPAGVTDTMAKRPLIILLHSGSFLPAYVNGQFDGGRNDSGIVFMCQSFAKRGYVVANVDYRTGWAPQASSLDIRRGTLITAFVRGVQDVKAAVRFMRKDAATTNTYKIDPDRIIVGGPATGGALAVNYAVLTDSNQLKIPKFVAQTTGGGFTAGQPYINQSVIGDLDGFGGNPAANNPNNSPGYSGRANFIFAFESMVGDSSWVVPGLPPIISVHRQTKVNNTQPYGNGLVSVNIGSVTQTVVDVSGSGVFIPLHNADGNNACFSPNNFTDPITVKAMQLSGGVEGLYPVQDSNAAITWYDSVSSVSACIQVRTALLMDPNATANCNGIWASYAGINNKAKNLTFIDTFMQYVNPRIYRCLYENTAGVSNAAKEPQGFTVAPNPSTGSVTVVAVGRTPSITAITIRDLAGRTVHRADVAGLRTNTVALQHLAPGLYMLTIAAGAETATQRLVIQR